MEEKTRKSEKKELLKNSAWLFGSKSTKSLINGIETILLARILGVDQFGLLSVIIAYVGIIKRFVDFRVWEGLIRYVGEFLESREDEKVISVIKLSYLVDIFSGVFALILSVLIAYYAGGFFNLGNESLVLIVIYSCSLIIDTANTTSEAVFRIFKEFKKITYLSTLEASVRLLLVLIALYAGFGLKGVLTAYVSAMLFGFINRQYFVLVVLKSRGIRFWLSGRIHYLKGRFREIMWFFLNTTIGGTLRMADDNYLGVLILGHYYGNDLAGLYKIARTSIKIMTRFTDPVYESIYPKMVEMINRVFYDDLSEIIKYAVKSLFKFTLPIAVVIIVFAEYILLFAFGKEYTAAANTMRVIAVGAILHQLSFWISPMFLAMDKVAVRTVYNIFDVITYIVLLVILSRNYGLIGAGYAFLFNRLLIFVFGIVLVNYFFKRLKKAR